MQVVTGDGDDGGVQDLQATVFYGFTSKSLINKSRIWHLEFLCVPMRKTVPVVLFSLIALTTGHVRGRQSMFAPYM